VIADADMIEADTVSAHEVLAPRCDRRRREANGDCADRGLEHAHIFSRRATCVFGLGRTPRLPRRAPARLTRRPASMPQASESSHDDDRGR
jgi:hypothetical protein